MLPFIVDRTNNGFMSYRLSIFFVATRQLFMHLSFKPARFTPSTSLGRDSPLHVLRTRFTPLHAPKKEFAPARAQDGESSNSTPIPSVDTPNAKCRHSQCRHSQRRHSPRRHSQCRHSQCRHSSVALCSSDSSASVRRSVLCSAFFERCRESVAEGKRQTPNHRHRRTKGRGAQRAELLSTPVGRRLSRRAPAGSGGPPF